MPFLTRQRAVRQGVALLIIGLSLGWLLLPTQARAATGTIADNAQVLNKATIQQITDQFSYTVDIFTTSDFQGSNDAFDAAVKQLTNDQITVNGPCDIKHQVGCSLYDLNAFGSLSDPNTPHVALRNTAASESIEIGIDVPARHLAIYSGKSVTIIQDHYDNAIQVFASTMHQTHDNYTQGTVAALNALENDSDRFWKGVRSAGPWLGLVALLAAPLIFALVSQAMGWKTPNSSDDNDDYYRRQRYNSWNNSNNNSSWNSGGGSNSGNSGGGGGGGASGNF